MLVSEEEHQGDRIVEFVHLLEVGDLIEVADINDGEILDSVGDFVKYFVLTHTVRVPVAAKSYHDQSLVLREDGLVDMPTGDKMGNNDGTHDDEEGGGGGGGMRCCRLTVASVVLVNRRMAKVEELWFET